MSACSSDIAEAGGDCPAGFRRNDGIQIGDGQVRQLRIRGKGARLRGRSFARGCIGLRVLWGIVWFLLIGHG
jgi:hypothetical protein